MIVCRFRKFTPSSRQAEPRVKKWSKPHSCMLRAACGTIPSVRAIEKFELKDAAHQDICAPVMHFVCVSTSGEQTFVWAETDRTGQTCCIPVCSVFEDGPLPPEHDTAQYIGSVENAGQMRHVYADYWHSKVVKVD